ncbi:IS5 family transposase [Pontibacter beigongshangensis]|uniref:IS5 family transposase n=1 Tax=Pontibacter beigongshangensis TaxID=2574733 RepID=UPI0019D5AC96|nr:IS5 family transposase [Pontibacter beigongshangensis]
MRRYEISDQAWHRISDLLPGKSTDVGRTARDNRQFINAVLWIARSGAPWRDLPERFGPWNSVYQRFRRWARKGVWQQVFEALQEPDLDWLLLDSTTVRAHQHAAGQKKQRQRQSLGRSRGGFSTKVHACCDALGNPRRFVLSVGQQSDHQQADALLAEDNPGAVVADKGYDSKCFAQGIAARGAEVVIPSRAKAKEPRLIDENLYKDRNKIERFFNRIKHYRRIATRYDKTAASYLAFVHVAAAMTLLL